MSEEATILVVDDQSEILENISLLLEDAGYTVFLAEDGLQALDILEEHPVDLVIADIAMPRMNGYQLLERIRENPAWVHLPFLFLTARAFDSDIRYGKEIGADDYLVKPIQPEDLLASVRGKLRRYRELLTAFQQSEGAHTLLLPAKKSPRLSLGRLQIEPGAFRAWMDGEPLKLSRSESLLLAYLAEREGQVISPPELIEVTHQLKTDAIEAGALLRPLIRNLRRKLGYATGEMGCIENVRGVGYRLVRPE